MSAWLGLLQDKNPDAAEVCSLLMTAAHGLDDLIDRDKPLADAEIQRMFAALAFDLPRNRFWRQYEAVLSPLLELCWLNWQEATRMERDKQQLEVAFVLRSDYANLMAMVALLVGGRHFAAVLIRDIRGDTHAEGFENYKLALRAEERARQQAEGPA